MKIDVKYTAKLSRLDLTEEQAAKFQKQFEDILGYVEKLTALNTADIPPLSHATSLKNVFREDKVRASLKTEEVLAGAPQKKGSFFKVPKVIK